LSGPVDDARLQALLSAGGNLEAMANSLVQAALDGGGRDNVTAVLIRYAEPWPPVGKTVDS
jgi:serine/threonine protein phosphatase PrpC